MALIDLTPAETLWLKELVAHATDPGPGPEPRNPFTGSFVANVAAGQIIESAWGNAMRDRTVQVFASVADRDTYWPTATAPPGALCVTKDTWALWENNSGTGVGRWTPPWQLPWGRMGSYADASAGPACGQTEGNALHGTAAFTAIANRQYKLIAVVPVGLAGSLTTVRARVRLDTITGTIMASGMATHQANGFQLYTLIGQGSITAGAHQAMFTLSVDTAGTANAASGGAGSASLLTVDDVGPATLVPTARPGDDDLEVTDAP